MMLKEASELKDTAFLRISRRRGMKINTEGIVNAVTRSQKPPIPKENATVPLTTNHKSKSSGSDPATSVAIPTVPFQVFFYTCGNAQAQGKTSRSPQGRGPQSADLRRFGSRKALSRSLNPYMIGGKRGEAWGEPFDKARKDNKLEHSTGDWTSPLFQLLRKRVENTGVSRTFDL